MLSITKFVLLLAVFVTISTADDNEGNDELEIKDNLPFEDLRALDPVNADGNDENEEEDAVKLLSLLANRNKLDDSSSVKYERRGWGRSWRRFTGRVRRFFRKVRTVYNNAKTVFGKK